MVHKCWSLACKGAHLHPRALFCQPPLKLRTVCIKPNVSYRVKVRLPSDSICHIGIIIACRIVLLRCEDLMCASGMCAALKLAFSCERWRLQQIFLDPLTHGNIPFLWPGHPLHSSLDATALFRALEILLANNSHWSGSWVKRIQITHKKQQNYFQYFQPNVLPAQTHPLANS